MSHVMCHVSHVTCHVSHVTCHVLLVTFFLFLTKLWSLSVEGLLSTGPTPSSFLMFWNILEGFLGFFWDMLGCSEMFWDVLRCFGVFWDVLGSFRHVFGGIICIICIICILPKERLDNFSIFRGKSNIRTLINVTNNRLNEQTNNNQNIEPSNFLKPMAGLGGIKKSVIWQFKCLYCTN